MNKDVRVLAVMECLWLSNESFQKPPLLTNPFPSARERHLSDENRDIYHTYLLYSHFHLDYHESLEARSLLRKEVSFNNLQVIRNLY